MYVYLFYFFEPWDRNSKNLGSKNIWGCENESNSEII